ncbi:hypothetical protein [Streptococcus sp. OMI870]|uniref:hypothetical protein n=1 Tax=Streptococcus sp. OMI870 TaxID=3047018 RepID=UPI0039C4C1C6
MKPEYLHNIATDLGLQFDSEARVMYGEREGFLLVIEGTETKNVFNISFSAKQGSEGDLIEEGKDIWDDLKTQSKAIHAISFNDYLTTVVVKGGMTKGKAVETLWTAIQDIVDFLLNHQFVQVNAATGEEEPIGLYQIGDTIYLIDDATFQDYHAEVQDTVQAYDDRKENFLLGIVGAVIGVIIGGAVALLVARLGYVSVLAGAALGFCTIKGYEILGKKLTKKGVVVSAILMVLTVLLVNQLDYILFLMDEYALPFDVSWSLFNEETFKGNFPENYFLELGKLAVFTLGGAWISVQSALEGKKNRAIARKIA